MLKVDIPQPTTETYGRYSIRFQAATTWNDMQNALPINMLSSYNEIKNSLTNYFYEWELIIAGKSYLL